MISKKALLIENINLNLNISKKEKKELLEYISNPYLTEKDINIIYKNIINEKINTSTKIMAPLAMAGLYGIYKGAKKLSNKVYERYMSEYSDKCKKLKFHDRTLCIMRAKKEALEKKLEILQNESKKCSTLDNERDKQNCLFSFKEELITLKRQLRDLNSKIAEEMEANNLYMKEQREKNYGKESALLEFLITENVKEKYNKKNKGYERNLLEFLISKPIKKNNK